MKKLNILAKTPIAIAILIAISFTIAGCGAKISRAERADYYANHQPIEASSVISYEFGEPDGKDRILEKEAIRPNETHETPPTPAQREHELNMKTAEEFKLWFGAIRLRFGGV
ncbi:MAG: hypothetical protein LBU73_00855 [Helicobacteraceae bacterium]|jgi:hypothetical protein|nr:hypothetical protein [Helicobacteraceae bacterium]